MLKAASILRALKKGPLTEEMAAPTLLFYHKYLPISYAIKECHFFMILDSLALEDTLHVITIQFGVLQIDFAGSQYFHYIGI